MRERTQEEATEFILERITQWISDLDYVEDAAECVLLEQIQGRIENGVMLHKTHAKALEQYMEREVESLMLQNMNSNKNKILLIDDWGVYPDVWVMYCRPGSYQI